MNKRGQAKKKERNQEIYSTWRASIDPTIRQEFKRTGRQKKTLVRAGFLAIGLVLLLSLIARLIAMSQFSTMGYEIEVLQERKAELTEENLNLRSAIASYQTTAYYRRKSAELGMKKATKITYLHIEGTERAENNSSLE